MTRHRWLLLIRAVPWLLRAAWNDDWVLIARRNHHTELLTLREFGTCQTCRNSVYTTVRHRANLLVPPT